MMTWSYHALFYEVDEQLRTIPKHPEATSGPARSSPWGCSMPSRRGQPALLSWLTRDYRPLFPHLPERTRLGRVPLSCG